MLNGGGAPGQEGGARPPLWQQDRKAGGFFGIGKGERPYNTRFSAVAAIGGSRPWYDPNGTRWLVFDNPHGRVRLPDGLLPADHRFQALDASRWGWHGAPSARPLRKGGTEPVHRPV